MMYLTYNMAMLACQQIEALHYTDLCLEVGLLLVSDYYGQGLFTTT